ncbi:oxysterol-binding protein-related protein 3-like isoform X2 [Halichondria panicea]|uniref:oxysterol-binding protein-related protein 3-like isoform X2 n=1 Tax=Halichondria panicea TaxID=6063 RepID=UPI00312B6CB5
MEGEESSHSKKNSKKNRHHQHASTQSKHSKSRQAPVPPSYAEFYKMQPPPTHKASSRGDRFSGLWEFYLDKEPADEGTGSEDDSLKNIRGYLLKRRKSPLKGWHKRYFVLERGVLYFSRSQAGIAKGKALGSLDLGMAFVHADGSSRRIDIDGEHVVVHLKTKNSSQFAAWSSTLRSHEMSRKAALLATASSSSQLKKEGLASPEKQGLDSWAAKIQDNISSIRKDMDSVGESLDTLSGFLSLRSTIATPLDSKAPDMFSDTLSLQSVGAVNDSARSMGGDSVRSMSGEAMRGVGNEGVATKPKKAKGFRKGKSEKKNKDSTISLSPETTPGSGCSLQEEVPPLIIENELLRESSCNDFTAVAKLVYAQFCEILEKLKRLEDDSLPKAVKQTRVQHDQQEKVISNQQRLLKQSLHQNNELRERLTQIQNIASGVEYSNTRMGTPGSMRMSPSLQSSHTGGLNIRRFESYISLQSSMSDKFFDALDDLHEQSSESEGEVVEDDSAEEESDLEMYEALTHEEAFTTLDSNPSETSIYTIAKNLSIREEPARSPDLSRDRGIQRRSQLPCPKKDDGDLSLWGILRKNIGKDLSKISMPVSLNEPLSALQRLCEELEYSELLDQASRLDDVYDRMVRIAAFAMSSYALSYHRVGRKPFNPILGETYEWVREDKGFKFIAEQVSHHPPIAACHCESPNYVFWQDARIKSKFWGKSMEVFPIGVVNVTLPRHDDHYQWQKVTSCIHNVLGGQRWVDQYGEMTITNGDKCSCKLTFVKASYWSNKKYQVYGDVYDASGTAVRHMFGAWHEAVFCGDSPETAQCIWRAGPMPDGYEDYYGFSQFAVELNELEEDLEDKLPCTDCRFRPDQRMLEEGKLQEAETEKHTVEQIQRAAQAERERIGQEWNPNFFHKQEVEGHESEWVFGGTYWTHRENNFRDITLPKLW